MKLLTIISPTKRKRIGNEFSIEYLNSPFFSNFLNDNKTMDTELRSTVTATAVSSMTVLTPTQIKILAQRLKKKENEPLDITTAESLVAMATLTIPMTPPQSSSMESTRLYFALSAAVSENKTTDALMTALNTLCPVMKDENDTNDIDIDIENEKDTTTTTTTIATTTTRENDWRVMLRVMLRHGVARAVHNATRAARRIAQHHVTISQHASPQKDEHIHEFSDLDSLKVFCNLTGIAQAVVWMKKSASDIAESFAQLVDGIHFTVESKQNSSVLSMVLVIIVIIVI